MSWDRPAIESRLGEILGHVFGVGPEELSPGKSFAEDLMAESLDYLDIELHVTQRFGFEFDFARAADEIRAAGTSPIRIRDLADWLERRLSDA